MRDISDPAPNQTLPDTTAVAIAAATKDIKLPAIYIADAVSWFQRAEVQFRLKRENCSTRMADHVLAALPEDIFPLILGWFADQEGAGASIEYCALKQRLLQNFVCTTEGRADKLLTLSCQPIGDQRPSIAFQEMKALTRIPHDDGTVKTLDPLRILWFL